MTLSEIKIVIGLVTLIVTSTWWGSQNLVFADPYRQYQQEQAVRWMMYDEQQLYREYREVITIKHKSDIDKQRLADLEHAMILKRDAIRDARNQ